jgi:predicted nucleic acid-binding protein
MNSLNFLDTNVWLALVWGRHSHSEAARDWFDRNEDEQFLFCRFTQLALLRLLTNKSVMGRDVKTMAAAWQIYDQCLTDERIAFLAEPQGIDPKP